MSLLGFIAVISTLQLVLHLTARYFKIKPLHALLLLVFLIGWFFFFPKLYTELFWDVPEDATCGMPFMSVMLGSWIFGIPSTIIAYVVSKILNRVISKNAKK
jgi:hypothetical protein